MFNLNLLLSISNAIASTTNDTLEEYTPTQVIVGTIAIYASLRAFLGAKSIYQQWDDLNIKKSAISYGLKAAMWMPVIGNKIQKSIDKEAGKTLASIKENIKNARAKYTAHKTLPYHSQDSKGILTRYKGFKPIFASLKKIMLKNK